MRSTNPNRSILIVVDSSTIGQDVNIGTFGSELAVTLEKDLVEIPIRDRIFTYLGKVFAHVIRRAGKVMAERTSLAGLAGTLSEELTRHMRCIYAGSQSAKFTFWPKHPSTTTHSVCSAGFAVLRIGVQQPCLPDSAAAHYPPRSEVRVQSGY